MPVFDFLLFLCSVDRLLQFYSPGTNPIEYNWYVNNWAVLHCLSLDNRCVVATVLEIKQILPQVPESSSTQRKAVEIATYVPSN